MFKKNKTNDDKKVDTIIGKETKMSGNLAAKGTIRVDGTFDGDIDTESNVLIGQGAYVKGFVKCSSAVLAGKLEGNVEAEMRLDIHATGVLLGDAVVSTLAVEDGAVFDGQCIMEGKTDHNPENKEASPGEDYLANQGR